MQNYKVWLKARDPKTLEVVAAVRVFNHSDRLAAEKALETAQTRLQMLVLQLLHVHPGAVVSTEMELPRQEFVRTTYDANGEPATLTFLPLGEERTFMGQPSPVPGVPK
jgi:hypothetical protein